MENDGDEIEAGKQAAPAEEVAGASNESIGAGALDGGGQPVPVVGLGGSAGSLEGMQEFFRHLPAGTGMAFVVVVHLAAEQESKLAEILQRHTRMPVMQVDEGRRIRPNEVYVIPPGRHFSMYDGMLRSVEMKRPKGAQVTVDLFFRTLAESHGSSATAIVFSGGDGDGATGLKRIKERGGLTIAQDPKEASCEGMPRAAMATGMVDWVLPAKEIPRRLVEFKENEKKIQLPAEVSEVQRQKDGEESREKALQDVLSFLWTRTGHDFAPYKRATLLRRIGRRMQVAGANHLESYLTYLRSHPGEAGALLEDLLISVTNFFRDPESFASLEAVLPEIFKNKGPLDQVRVWVAATATGEEAYSIAILLLEYAAKLESPPKIQIFATDIHQAAIQVAREGRYPESIVADVSEDRLERFFTEEPGGYRVKRPVREMVLFAIHNVLTDSPFSQLDLVSCRNMLIYLNREAQARVFALFHFALHPGGLLLLGLSESAEEASALFHQIDKNNRIYERRATVLRSAMGSPADHIAPLSFRAMPSYHFSTGTPGGYGVQEAIARPERPTPATSETHLKLLERIAPPSLVVRRDYQIMHLSQNVGKYLQVGGGEPTMNLMRLIHPKLRHVLRAALVRALKTESPVRAVPTQVETDAGRRIVSVSVEPAGDLGKDLMLVVFHEQEPDGELPPVEDPSPDAMIMQHLEQELADTKSDWRKSVEQYDASMEDLKASNEELQAMNEELRSATEELETSREELQSINEEIITINQELKSKVEELSRSNSDLQNLMSSTKIATIFLDRQLFIKRFTPAATALFNLIPTDLGRPLSDLTHHLDYPGICSDAESVLESLSIVEREVLHLDGRCFLARILPYRTSEDQIAGVVITCVDITERKDAEQMMRWLSAIVQSSNHAIISFSIKENIMSWNPGAERIFGYSAEEISGQPMAVLYPSDKEDEKEDIFQRLMRGEMIDQFDTVRLRKDGRLIDVAVSASVIRNAAGEAVGGTIIAQDIGLRKKAVEELRLSKQELEGRVEERTTELRKRVEQLRRMASQLTLTEQSERKRMAHVLHDQLQQTLVAAKMRVEALELPENTTNRAESRKLVSLLDQALENSRSLAIELSPPILAEGLGKALEWLCGEWIKEKYNLEVTRRIDLSLDAAGEDMRNLIFLTVRELLFNVVKHSNVNQASVGLGPDEDGNLRVTVSDHGKGFDIKQAGKSGSGFGLATLHERLEMLGGRLQISSSPGHGVETVILAPMKQLEN